MKRERERKSRDRRKKGREERGRERDKTSGVEIEQRRTWETEKHK